jgi:hypothetical protein
MDPRFRGDDEGFSQGAEEKKPGIAGPLLSLRFAAAVA